MLTLRTCTPLLPNVSSEATSRTWYRFFSNREPLLNSFTSRYIADFEGNETPGNRLINLLRHIFYNSFIPSVKVKLKFTVVGTLKASMENRDIALLFL